MKTLLTVLRYGAAALIVIILVSSAALYGASEYRMRKSYAITPVMPAIPRDSATVARGAHLAHSYAGCVDCHGENLAGQAMIDNLPIGRLYSANLTAGAGGVAAQRSDTDLVRAIRHGVRPDGRPLVVMPSRDYAELSESDLAAIVAYIRAQPPVDNQRPDTRIGPVARALLLAGKMPLLDAERIDHARPPRAAVQPGVTVEYGRYLASVGCQGCHGPTLAGGPIPSGPPDWPPAADLTPSGNLAHYTLEDFTRILRTGKRPNGFPVNPIMPWQKLTRNLTDEEIGALWLYLKSLPEKNGVRT